MTTLALPGITPAPPVGARRDADFYPTPIALWRPFVAVLRRRMREMGIGAIIEPACGDGRMLGWLEDIGRGLGICPPVADLGPSRTLGVDVRPEAVEATRARGLTAHCVDWLDPASSALVPTGAPVALVTNPPFCVGLEFARSCIDRAGPGGLVALLLRITWLEPTVDRAPFLVEHPADVWISTKRVPFAGDSTDSATTAWFVWPPERPAPGHTVRYLGHQS